MKHIFPIREHLFGSRSRRHARILPGLALALALGFPLASVFLPSAPTAKGDDAGAPDPDPNQEATPTPTSTPSGHYVFDNATVVTSLDQSGNDSVCSGDGGAGDVSANAQDGFDAGTLGSTWVDGTRNDSVTTTYNWHWETDEGAPPAPYSPIYSGSYSGTATSEITGSSFGTVGGSYSATGGGSASLLVNGVTPDYLFETVGQPQPGAATVSLSQTISLSTALNMGAHDGKANGSVAHQGGGGVGLGQ